MKSKRRADGRLQRGFTIDGKRYTVYGRSAKELAENERAKRDAIAEGMHARSNPTMRDYFAQYQSARRGHVKETTLYTTQSKYNACDNVSVSAGVRFGDLRLRDIQASDIRTVQQQLIADGATTNTVNQYMGMLRSIFKAAVGDRLIEYNPCLPVKLLRRTEEAARDTIHRALTDAEQQLFFEGARGSYYYNVFRFALNTGMRCGEICALRYADIKDGAIHIKRTATRTESGSVIAGTDAKTQSGIRSITINAATAEIITEQKRANEILFGNVLSASGDDLLFRTEGGEMLYNAVLNKAIKRVCAAQGIGCFTMHAFRDTFATKAIESGMQPRVLMEILGHKNIAVTMNLYAHVTDDAKREAMQRVQFVC